MNQHKKKTSASTTSHRHANHQVRIIGGEWKRTPLTVIGGDGLRPTPDRVRETVFNWINHLIDGNWANLRCLDLFAGSGALGFEAASRGAASVLMCEAYTPAYTQLLQSKDKLKAAQIDLKRGDALIYSKNLIANKEKFGLIFLDPPFNQGFLEKILPLCENLLEEEGLLYVESEQALDLQSKGDNPENSTSWSGAWEVIRQDKAGQVYFHLLQRNRKQGQVTENLG